MAAEKIYILDTNVLVHDPLAMYAFKGAHVGIPAMVLEELDKFKTEPTGRGRNSREAIRQFDEMRSYGSLRDGITLKDGTMVRVIYIADDKLPKIPFSLTKADNLILAIALTVKQAGYDVRFISKDINARVKADILGIKTEDYTREHISETEFYKGWVQVESAGDCIKEVKICRQNLSK